MNEVAVTSSLAVQLLEPVSEEAMDELPAALLPALEDELPQGVLELLAATMLRHRPAMDAGRAIAWQTLVATAQSSQDEHDALQPATQVSMPRPPASPSLGKPLQLPVPAAALFAPLADDPVTQSIPASAGPDSPLNSGSHSMTGATAIERQAIIERQVNAVESLRVDRLVASAASRVGDDEMHRPEIIVSPLVKRAEPSAVRPSVAPAVMQQRQPPMHDALLERLPDTGRGLLQVPFNKGAVSGQVTISRVADEPTRHLQLSPSNALVFEQIKLSLEQVREPAWQLRDDEGGQQGRGSHHSPDDEQEEQSGYPA